MHGALLDAELLADVYINLTRGQDALLIADEDQKNGTGIGAIAFDFGVLNLQMLPADEREQAAHADVLAQIDKASGGKTIWRALQAS